MIDYHHVKGLRFETEHRYTTRDAVFYALSLGMSEDPLDAKDLAYTFELGDEPLRVLPSMNAVLTLPGWWVADPKTGVDVVRLVNGETRITFHDELRPEDTLIGRTRITSITDKGAGKGALLWSEREMVRAATGEKVATAQELRFCRGDGGYSAAGLPSDEPPPPLAATPTGAPDLTWQAPTRPNMALFYRLNGDLNPLHADPKVAAAAGYSRPLLHGMATYGLACRAVVDTWLGGGPGLGSLDMRYTAPLFPGETVRVDMWEVDDALAFRMVVPERDVVVANNGHATRRG